MQVETYEQSEVAALPDEERAEFSRIAASLGLIKQQALIGDRNANPFRRVTEEERRVYQTLLDQTTKLEDFDAGVIPLRILKLAHLCKLNGWFEVLHIWHSPSEKDPVLVGRTDSTYNSPTFLLGRWGDELESFETLRQRAIQKRIALTRAERQKALANVEQDAVAYMHGNGW